MNWLWSIIDRLAVTDYRLWNCNRFPTLSILLPIQHQYLVSYWVLVLIITIGLVVPYRALIWGAKDFALQPCWRVFMPLKICTFKPQTVYIYRWTWIWRTQWDQENWSVICNICSIHMTNTWYESDWDQAYRPSYAKICHTVVCHIQVHLYHYIGIYLKDVILVLLCKCENSEN